MFGSDWPVCLSAAAYNQVLESTQSLLADMSEEDSSRIFERNARDFYRLG
jgi:L-fuconolactonase